MPIFEYRCSTCGHEFESLVLRGSAEPACASCGGAELERLISRSAVSSENSRRSALSGLRARNARVRTEISHEEHKRFHDHDH